MAVAPKSSKMLLWLHNDIIFNLKLNIMMFFFYVFYIYACIFILLDKTTKTWKTNCQYCFTAQDALSPFICQQTKNKIRQCRVALACAVYHDQSYSSWHPWFM